VRVDHDLYVLKCGSGPGLSLAGALHALGAATLNPYPVVAACRDKIMTAAILAAAGAPVPDAWLMGDIAQVRDLLEDGPVVVKPHRGSRGMGVQVVGSPAELDGLQIDSGPVFAQRYHQPEGLDHKLYVIAGKVRGVRRVWPAETLDEKLGEPFEPGAELCEIARLCSAALRIDTFGFDVVYSAGAPVVVDLSALPGFKGVPDAVPLLTEVIDAAARRAVRGQPVTTDA
jgi:ribosomal protein S6--L-glutamate ligase